MSWISRHTQFVASFIFAALTAASVWVVFVLAHAAAQSPLPDLTQNPLRFLQTLEAVGKQGKWFALALIGLVGMVGALKFVAGKLGTAIGGDLGKLIAWVDSDRGGAILALTAGVAGSIAVTLMSGGTLSLPIILAGLSAGFTAIGGFTGIKRILAPSDVVKSDVVAVNIPADPNKTPTDPGKTL